MKIKCMYVSNMAEIKMAPLDFRDTENSVGENGVTSAES